MGKPRLNLTGKQFGHLTVLEFSHGDGCGNYYWLCECDCPDKNKILAKGHDLTRGHKTSCGCRWRTTKKDDLIGKQFGRLTVLSYDHTGDDGNAYWLCECSCGNTKVISRINLMSGHVKSCGCYRSEWSSAIHSTHRSSNTRLYKIWQGMKRRCTNEHNDFFNHYGGRGITVCDEWQDFENFQEWAMNNNYSPDLTIDRIDNDAGYCPENCRWVDRTIQANNKSNNRYIEYNGERDTMSNWARRLGVDYDTLKHRIYHGDMRDFEVYFGSDQ